MTDALSEAGALRAELEYLTYAVGHDLRAPLRAVIGYAAALHEDFGASLDDEARRLLAVVSNEASRAMRMLDALLELSRLASSALAYERIDMTALAREVAREIGGDDSASHRIAIASLPPIDADRALVRTALTCVLANAMTATDGRVDARIAISGSANETGTTYTVADNGIGFDMRYGAKLFHPFAKLHGAGRFPGVGKGLASVDRIVRRHGGTVRANARPEEGASFSFTFPTEVAP